MEYSGVRLKSERLHILQPLSGSWQGVPGLGPDWQKPFYPITPQPFCLFSQASGRKHDNHHHTHLSGKDAGRIVYRLPPA